MAQVRKIQKTSMKESLHKEKANYAAQIERHGEKYTRLDHIDVGPRKGNACLVAIRVPKSFSDDSTAFISVDNRNWIPHPVPKDGRERSLDEINRIHKTDARVLLPENIDIVVMKDGKRTTLKDYSSQEFGNMYAATMVARSVEKRMRANKAPVRSVPEIISDYDLDNPNPSFDSSHER